MNSLLIADLLRRYRNGEQRVRELLVSRDLRPDDVRGVGRRRPNPTLVAPRAEPDERRLVETRDGDPATLRGLADRGRRRAEADPLCLA